MQMDTYYYAKHQIQLKINQRLVGVPMSCCSGYQSAKRTAVAITRDHWRADMTEKKSHSPNCKKLVMESQQSY